jgi:hypothetical protein
MACQRTNKENEQGERKGMPGVPPALRDFSAPNKNDAKNNEGPMEEYLLRFVIGGLAVSLFSLLGALFRPKSFAGLFGAAPSIALSTLAMALTSQGPSYAAREGRAMIVGAIALCLYAILVCQLLERTRLGAASATMLALLAWLAVAGAGLTLLPG